MYSVRPPLLVRAIWPGLLWRIPTTDRVVYLTFDDGPEPTVTPWVLDQLAAHGAKATFFCIGRNAQARPDLLERIRMEEHTVGHHTYGHSNGWQTPSRSYYRDVLNGAKCTGGPLFRPPYGRLRPAQAHMLRKHYTVVMWDVLSGDFDTRMDGAECARRTLQHLRPGSIVVFHDSVKAAPRLQVALPLVLASLRDQGYTMAALNP